MTKIILIIALAIGLQADVFVNGYYKSNGTYVQPHYRTAPDSNKYNNYSSPKSSNSYGFGSSSSYGTSSSNYGGARYNSNYSSSYNPYKQIK